MLVPLRIATCSLRICVALLQKPVVQLPTDGLSFVIELVNIPRAGVRNPHDGPKRLGLALALMGLVLCVAHLLVEPVKDLQ